MMMAEELQFKPIARFRALSEQDVLTAMDDPDPANAVTVEVNRLIEGYKHLYEEAPRTIQQFVPRWPIEVIALRLAKRDF